MAIFYKSLAHPDKTRNGHAFRTIITLRRFANDLGGISTHSTIRRNGGIIVMIEWTNVVAIVDDDPRVLNAIDTLLHAHGYGRELYRSAQAFLKNPLTSTASCAIIDIQLGSDSGIELVRQLKRVGYSVPVILMTASNDEATRERALQAGCIGFLRKPFNPDVLIALLGDARRRIVAP